MPVTVAFRKGMALPYELQTAHWHIWRMVACTLHISCSRLHTPTTRKGPALHCCKRACDKDYSAHFAASRRFSISGAGGTAGLAAETSRG